MGIPFNHSRVTDGIIRALRYSGLFGSDNTAQAIRDLDNDMTDSELDAIVAGLDYGGSGSAGQVTSLDDIYLFVDSDGQPAASHINFLRVTHSMDTAPISSPPKTVMSAYYNPGDNSGPQRAEVVIGPDTEIMRTQSPIGSKYQGGMYVGGKADSGNITAYGAVKGGETVLYGGNAGMLLQSRYDMQMYCNDHTTFWYNDQDFYNGGDPRLLLAPLVPAFMLGGFRGDTTGSPPTPVFHIGEYGQGVTDTNALIFSGNGTTKEWDVIFNTEDGTVIRFVPRNSNYFMSFEVNAAPTGSSPEIYRNLGANMDPKFIVYSDRVTGGPDKAVAAVRGLLTDYYGNLLLLRTSDKDTATPDKSFYLRCQALHPTLPGVYIDYFTVSNTGDVCARGSITPSGGCDVAEWVVVPGEVESCDVIVMDTDGTYKKSTEVADGKVVGVIAETPGINLGLDSSVENQHPLTVCGITPVKCTTANGEITPGDLIVSAPDGAAQKSDYPPTPGTIIGKALAPLEQPEEDTVVGMVKALVILQ